jgi:hypothetical protein
LNPKHHYPSLLLNSWLVFPQVTELQKELKERGLDAKGKKDELIARLQDYLSKEQKLTGTISTQLCCLFML